MLNIRRPFLYYSLFLSMVSWLCFGSLRDHLLEGHDAESFADHLLIDQDPSYFFSHNKQQATGRFTADGAKYAVYLVFGNNPAAFHLAVVAAHLLAALLLALLIYRLYAAQVLAMLTGLLFLLNVTHFQAIHHISALDYPLGMVCICAAWLCWESNYRARMWMFALLMVLAVQAHPSFAALWLLPLYRLWQARAARRMIYAFGLTALPIAAAVVVSVLMASRQASTWHAIREYGAQSTADLIVGQVDVMLFLTSRLLSTAHWVLTPIYSQAPWEIFLGLVIVIALAYALYRRQAPYDLAALWILAGLLPYVLLTSSVIEDLPAGPSRYLYVANAGSSMLLAAALQSIIERQRYVGIACVIGIGISSYVYLKKVEAISLYSSGRGYIAEGDFNRGAQQLHRALEQSSDVLPLAETYSRYIQTVALTASVRDLQTILGDARAQHPNIPRLELYLLAAQSTSPDTTLRKKTVKLLSEKSRALPNGNGLSAILLGNMCRSLLQLDEIQQAVIACENALVIQPERTGILSVLGDAHVRHSEVLATARRTEYAQESLRSATVSYQKSLDDTLDAQVLFSLGHVYTQRGLLDSAISTYQTSLFHHSASTLPHRAEIHFKIGNLYMRLGDVENALGAYEASYQIQPNSMELLGNMGSALRQLGRLEEAHTAYMRAVDLAPNNPHLLYAIGDLLYVRGDVEAATETIALAFAKGLENKTAYDSFIALLRAQGRDREADTWEKKRLLEP